MKSIAWIGVFLLCSVAGAQTPAPPAPETPQAPQTQQAPPEPAPTTPATPPTPVTPPPPPLSSAAPPEENIENMTSVALYNWRTSGGMQLLPGSGSIQPAAQTLVLPNNPPQANGVVFTLRAKGPTRIELSYFDVRNTGNVISPAGLSLYTLPVSPGDYLVIDYRIRATKLTWNYLTFPVPALDAKLRLKTLWEAQFVSIRPNLNSPFTANLPVTAQGRVIVPTFGLGVEYVPSKHFRMETRFSGWGLPHRAVLWDGEMSFVGRFRSMEIFGGIKGFHFRTSAKADIYMDGTLWGPNAGLRWVFK